MLKHFKVSDFSDHASIEYWDNIYDKLDIDSDSFRKRIDKALTWINSFDSSEYPKVLDVGCGAGRFVSKAVEKGYDVCGVDYSYGMLVRANSICNREGQRNVIFIQGDIEELPLRTSSFDVIICLGVIAFLKSPEKAFSELARVLKPNGVLVISFINKARLVNHLDFPLMVKGMIQKIINRIILNPKKGPFPKNDFSSRAYFIPFIQKSLEQIGFKIIDRETITPELLSFFRREILPRKMSIKINLFIDQYSHIPVIGSLGSWYMLKAIKKSINTN